MLATRADVRQIAEQAREFHARLNSIKARLAPRSCEWSPYDSLANVLHLDSLLTGQNRDLRQLIGDGQVADVGCSDGDLAFFLESLGCRVQAIDHPVANHNGMQGLRALHEALGSSIEIHTVDLDSQFMLPNDNYRLVFFLGVLYHLKNPYYVLEMLARQCDYCVLSTRIANTLPGQRIELRDAPIAYLLDEQELNNDETNYWIFSEAGLRRLLKRTRWEICDFFTAGVTSRSDPNSLDRDQRVWCLLKSRYYSLSQAELLTGWHAPESAGWRWTEQRFSARLDAGATRPARFELRFFVPQALIDRYGSVTIQATADGSTLPSMTLRQSGRFVYRGTLRQPPSGAMSRLDFSLDHALSPNASDERELGIVVAALERAP